MRSIQIFAFALLLAGCSDISTYQPYVQDISDAVALARDKADCLKYAQAYRTPMNVQNIATQAAKGAAGNMAGAAVNPLVPVLGAAGAASVAVLDGIGILNDAQRRIFLKCLDHRGERSRAYMLIDPNE